MGQCSSNTNENDCNTSLLGCVWENNKCTEGGTGGNPSFLTEYT